MREPDRVATVVLAGPDAHLQGVEGEVGAKTRRELPTDHAAREHVDHERRVDPAGEGSDVCDVRDPELIRAGGGERPLDEIQRQSGRIARHGRARVDPATVPGLSDLGLHAPHALWVRGDIAALSAGRRLAIAGARAATNYGESVCADITVDVVAAGVTVHSGGAYGIDAAAHRTALMSGGATVAWLAGGVDRMYPIGRAQLADRIAGALLSYRRRGVAHITVVDIIPSRLDKARQLGADDVINSAVEDLEARLYQIHGEVPSAVGGIRCGADIYLDAAGAPAIPATVFKLIKTSATYGVVAIHKKPVEVDLQGLLMLDITIALSGGYTDTEIFTITDDLIDNWEQYAQIISDPIPYTDVERGLNLALTPGAADKIVIVFDE